MDKSISRKRFLAGMAGLAVVTLVDGCGGSSVSSTSAGEAHLEAGQEGMTAVQAALFDAAPHLPPIDLAGVHLADSTTVAGALAALTNPPVTPQVPDVSNSKKGETQGPEAPVKTPGTYKRECIAQMIATGNALADRARHQYPSEGADAPAQTGLSYVFGSKNPMVRARPIDGGERTYGLDASGLVTVCAAGAGIVLPASVTAADLIDPSTWNAVLPRQWNLKMMTVTDGSFQSGDIIGNGNHVGIISDSEQTGPAVIQSYGVREMLAFSPAASAQDRLNSGTRRGPAVIPLTAAEAYFKTANLQTVRLAPASSFVVELNWGAQPDLDLHVFEPDGTHVYYVNKIGHSGSLDRDCVTGFGPEHYTTIPGLQDGNYRVGVNYYAGNAPEIGVILISAGTQTSNYRVPVTTAVGFPGDDTPIMAATINVVTDGATGHKTFTIT